MNSRQLVFAFILAATAPFAASVAAAEEPSQSGSGKVHPVAETKKVAKAVGHGTRKTTKAIGHGFRDGARAIGHGTRNVTRDIGHAFRDGAHEIAGNKK